MDDGPLDTNFAGTQKRIPTTQMSDPKGQHSNLTVITGAAGFIGSCLAAHLNAKGNRSLVLVDDFSRDDKRANWQGRDCVERVDRDTFFQWLDENRTPLAGVFHLGARTDTTEFDYSVHQRLNVEYSQKVWNYCSDHGVDLVYASSAATYGDGSQGYRDDHSGIDELEPLNPYGVSKNEFDKWALRQTKAPPRWYGLKFFNVYGPNEYHKQRMASVIFHSFNQIRDRGYVELFKSHRADFADGGQLRDFVYVKDVVDVCEWLSLQLPASGIYNLGTGKARSFEDLARAVFSAMDKEQDIRYIDMPADIRDKYQYFTEADMRKLRSAGYAESFRALEEGVGEYVRGYLGPHRYE
jgi:ADP-L-glycero-D-manno-heptose 6-epimerase